MAVIVTENGSGLASANSYVSEADCTFYATDRGASISGVVADLLIKAMDYIESNNFIGRKKTMSQALQWPRYDVVIDGFYPESTEIPLLLKDALCEVVIGIDGGTNPLANVPRETVKEKVDVIEVEYSASARPQTYLLAAETKLKKITKSNQSRAIRG